MILSTAVVSVILVSIVHAKVLIIYEYKYSNNKNWLIHFRWNPEVDAFWAIVMADSHLKYPVNSRDGSSSPGEVFPSRPVPVLKNPVNSRGG